MSNSYRGQVYDRSDGVSRQDRDRHRSVDHIRSGRDYDKYDRHRSYDGSDIDPYDRCRRDNSPSNGGTERQVKEHTHDRRRYSPDREANRHYKYRESDIISPDRDTDRHYGYRERDRTSSDRETDRNYGYRERDRTSSDRETDRHYGYRERDRTNSDRETDKHYRENEKSKTKREHTSESGRDMYSRKRDSETSKYSERRSQERRSEKRRPDDEEGNESKRSRHKLEQVHDLLIETDDDPEHVQSQVFIGNLPSDTTEDDMQDLFRNYSTEVWIGYHRDKKEDRCAFVKLQSMKESKKLIIEKKKSVFGGREIVVRFTAAQDFNDFMVIKDKVIPHSDALVPLSSNPYGASSYDTSVPPPNYQAPSPYFSAPPPVALPVFPPFHTPLPNISNLYPAVMPPAIPQQYPVTPAYPQPPGTTQQYTATYTQMDFVAGQGYGSQPSYEYQQSHSQVEAGFQTGAQTQYHRQSLKRSRSRSRSGSPSRSRIDYNQYRARSQSPPQSGYPARRKQMVKPTDYAVCITNLPYHITAAELERYLDRYSYTSIVINEERQTSDTVYAVVYFQTQDEARQTVRDLDRKDCYGRTINVQLNRNEKDSYKEKSKKQKGEEDTHKAKEKTIIPSLLKTYVDQKYANVPLLGMKYITEFMLTDYTKAIHVCSVCEMQCFGDMIAEHLVGYKHRLKCLKRDQRQVYEDITYIKKKEDMLIECDRAAANYADCNETVETIITDNLSNSAKSHLDMVKRRNRDREKDEDTPKPIAEDTTDIFKRLEAYKKKFEAVKQSDQQKEKQTQVNKDKVQKVSRHSRDPVSQQQQNLASSIMAEISLVRKEEEMKEENDIEKTLIHVKRKKMDEEKHKADEIKRKVAEAKQMKLLEAKRRAKEEEDKLEAARTKAAENKNKLAAEVKLRNLQEVHKQEEEELKKKELLAKKEAEEKAERTKREEEIRITEEKEAESEKVEEIEQKVSTATIQKIDCHSQGGASDLIPETKNTSSKEDIPDWQTTEVPPQHETLSDFINRLEMRKHNLKSNVPNSQKLGTHPYSKFDQFRADFCKKKIPKPLIGLEYVTEVIPTMPESLKKFAYYCGCCHMKTEKNTVNDHLQGGKHRMNYMKLVWPKEHKEIEERDAPKAAINRMVSEKATWIEEQTGRHQLLGIMKDEFDILLKNKEAMEKICKIVKKTEEIAADTTEPVPEIRPDPTDKSLMEIINVAMSAETVMFEEGKTWVLFYKYIDNSCPDGTPLLGLNYITEIQDSKMELSRCPVVYYCGLCGTTTKGITNVTNSVKAIFDHTQTFCHLDKVIPLYQNHFPRGYTAIDNIDDRKKDFMKHARKSAGSMPRENIRVVVMGDQCVGRDISFVKMPMPDVVDLTSDDVDVTEDRTTEVVITQMKLTDMLKGTDEAIVGLSYIVEIQGMLTTAPPKYQCKLCDITETAACIKAHLTGVYHRKKFLKSHYPVLHTKCEEKILLMEMFVKEIENQYGREPFSMIQMLSRTPDGTPKYSTAVTIPVKNPGKPQEKIEDWKWLEKLEKLEEDYNKNQVEQEPAGPIMHQVQTNNKSQVEQKPAGPIMHQVEQEANGQKMNEVKRPLCFDELIIGLGHTPLLGLSYITEVQHPAGNIQSVYTCLLCNGDKDLIKWNKILTHICTKGHRMNFFREKYPSFYKEIYKLPDQQAKKLLNAHTRTVERKHGRETINCIVIKHAKDWERAANLSGGGGRVFQTLEEWKSLQRPSLLQQHHVSKQQTVTSKTQAGTSPSQTVTSETQVGTSLPQTATSTGQTCVRKPNSGSGTSVDSDSPLTPAIKGSGIDMKLILNAKEDKEFCWEKDYGEIQQKINSRKIVNSNKKSRLHDSVMSSCSDSVIGLQYMTEFQDTDVKQHPWFLCRLCEDKISWIGAVNHVNSLKHRVKYMALHFPVMHKLLAKKWFISRSSLEASVKTFSEVIVKKESNRAHVPVVMLELHPSQSSILPVVVAAQPAGSKGLTNQIVLPVTNTALSDNASTDSGQRPQIAIQQSVQVQYDPAYTPGGDPQLSTASSQQTVTHQPSESVDLYGPIQVSRVVQMSQSPHLPESTHLPGSVKLPGSHLFGAGQPPGLAQLSESSQMSSTSLSEATQHLSGTTPLSNLSQLPVSKPSPGSFLLSNSDKTPNLQQFEALQHSPNKKIPPWQKLHYIKLTSGQQQKQQQQQENTNLTQQDDLLQKQAQVTVHQNCSFTPLSPGDQTAIEQQPIGSQSSLLPTEQPICSTSSNQISQHLLNKQFIAMRNSQFERNTSPQRTPSNVSVPNVTDQSKKVKPPGSASAQKVIEKGPFDTDEANDKAVIDLTLSDEEDSKIGLFVPAESFIGNTEGGDFAFNKPLSEEELKSVEEEYKRRMQEDDEALDNFCDLDDDMESEPSPEIVIPVVENLSETTSKELEANTECIVDLTIDGDDADEKYDLKTVVGDMKQKATPLNIISIEELVSGEDVIEINTEITSTPKKREESITSKHEDHEQCNAPTSKKGKQRKADIIVTKTLSLSSQVSDTIPLNVNLEKNSEKKKSKTEKENKAKDKRNKSTVISLKDNKSIGAGVHSLELKNENQEQQGNAYKNHTEQNIEIQKTFNVDNSEGILKSLKFESKLEKTGNELSKSDNGPENSVKDEDVLESNKPENSLLKISKDNKPINSKMKNLNEKNEDKSSHISLSNTEETHDKVSSTPEDENETSADFDDFIFSQLGEDFVTIDDVDNENEDVQIIDKELTVVVDDTCADKDGAKNMELCIAVVDVVDKDGDEFVAIDDVDDDNEDAGIISDDSVAVDKKDINEVISDDIVAVDKKENEIISDDIVAVDKKGNEVISDDVVAVDKKDNEIISDDIVAVDKKGNEVISDDIVAADKKENEIISDDIVAVDKKENEVISDDVVAVDKKDNEVISNEIVAVDNKDNEVIFDDIVAIDKEGNKVVSGDIVNLDSDEAVNSKLVAVDEDDDDGDTIDTEFVAIDEVMEETSEEVNDIDESSVDIDTINEDFVTLDEIDGSTEYTEEYDSSRRPGRFSNYHFKRSKLDEDSLNRKKHMSNSSKTDGKEGIHGKIQRSSSSRTTTNRQGSHGVKGQKSSSRSKTDEKERSHDEMGQRSSSRTKAVEKEKSYDGKGQRSNSRSKTDHRDSGDVTGKKPYRSSDIKSSRSSDNKSSGRSGTKLSGSSNTKHSGSSGSYGNKSSRSYGSPGTKPSGNFGIKPPGSSQNKSAGSSAKISSGSSSKLKTVNIAPSVPEKKVPLKNATSQSPDPWDASEMDKLKHRTDDDNLSKREKQEESMEEADAVNVDLKTASDQADGDKKVLDSGKTEDIDNTVKVPPTKLKTVVKETGIKTIKDDATRSVSRCAFLGISIDLSAKDRSKKTIMNEKAETHVKVKSGNCEIMKKTSDKQNIDREIVNKPESKKKVDKQFETIRKIKQDTNIPAETKTNTHSNSTKCSKSSEKSSVSISQGKQQSAGEKEETMVTFEIGASESEEKIGTSEKEDINIADEVPMETEQTISGLAPRSTPRAAKYKIEQRMKYQYGPRSRGLLKYGRKYHPYQLNRPVKEKQHTEECEVSIEIG